MKTEILLRDVKCNSTSSWKIVSSGRRLHDTEQELVALGMRLGVGGQDRFYGIAYAFNMKMSQLVC